MNSPLPVPGITWQTPDRAKPSTATTPLKSSTATKSTGTGQPTSLNSSPSVTTVPGIIDKSQALPNWRQRSTLNKFDRTC